LLSFAFLLVFVTLGNAFAQFSPGELSKAHQQLEGMNNCLQCHETGKEISGKRCLTCHQEIKTAIDAERGYHFKVSHQQCIACHKEHVGKDAKTTLFDKDRFDHNETGFPRTGKHSSITCADCHTKKNIKDAKVLEIINKSGKQTYLGLAQACASCHHDKHNNTVRTDCKSCHDTKAWSPAAKAFDHSKTDYKLEGKHASVVCSKCHTEFERKEKDKPLLFTTKSFNDCTPCHPSPHSEKFAMRLCNSCHSSEAWNSQRASGKFNHDLTAFKLVGKHAAVSCEKCHKSGTKSSPSKSLRLAHNKCIDCHADYHKGEFVAKFNSDCRRCHTTFGFQPATFTLAAHNTGRFALNGAHAATPCEKCHTNASDGRKVFHFENIKCESCHKDKHGGQFAKEMAGQSCAACHSTIDWFPKSFDHSKTNFALVGKHAQAKCEGCHKSKNVGVVEVTQYRGTPTKCESCHKEVHGRQFAVNSETNCVSCHQPQGWKLLVFDHSTQSVFALTGAHKRVECRLCHREERRGETTFVRYKPMSTKCESCHAQGSFGNG
jgi:hypothetical protein